MKRSRFEALGLSYRQGLEMEQLFASLTRERLSLISYLILWGRE